MTVRETPMAERRLVLPPPDDRAVDVQRNIEIAGADGAPIALDLYRPSGESTSPVAVCVVGYPGAAPRARAGGAFKDMAFVRDWAAWFAASGIAAITYTNRDPAGDLSALLAHIASVGSDWGVDPSRIGLFAQSGSVPVALSALLSGRTVRPACAAFTYGFMLDAPGLTAVADASTAFGFANPCAGRTIEDLDPSVPILVVRAGQDQFAGLNGTIDMFVSGALARNMPVSLVNLPAAPHGFDLVDSSRASHDAIRHVIAYMRARTTGRV